MKGIANHRLAPTPVLAMCLLLAACGFQLRGALQFDPALSPMGIEAVRAGSPLLPPLRRTLVNGGITLAPPNSRVSYILRILVDETGERVIVVTAQGRPREMELFHRVEFELIGVAGTLIERRTIVRTREFGVDERDVLGKAHEAATLREDLLQEMVAALARQVATANVPVQ